MKRRIEKSERRALAGAGKSRTRRELRAPLDVRGRQRPQRARYFGKRELREMPRLELRDPPAESIVYGQNDETILPEFIRSGRAGSRARKCFSLDEAAA